MDRLEDFRKKVGTYLDLVVGIEEELANYMEEVDHIVELMEGLFVIQLVVKIIKLAFPFGLKL